MTPGQMKVLEEYEALPPGMAPPVGMGDMALRSQSDKPLEGLADKHNRREQHGEDSLLVEAEMNIREGGRKGCWAGGDHREDREDRSMRPGAGGSSFDAADPVAANAAYLATKDDPCPRSYFSSNAESSRLRLIP